jgi:hypothetical protein
MLINNKHGTFVVLEDKVFHIEGNHIFNTGPIPEEELKEIELTDWHVVFNKNSFWHRDNDLPAIIYADGTKVWYQKGRFIRREHANQQ